MLTEQNFEDIYSASAPNDLGSVPGNARAIIDLLGPIIDAPDNKAQRATDTINTFCIEAETNANYESNWNNRLDEIENSVEEIKQTYPEVGVKIEELITVPLEPIWDNTAEERQDIN